MMREQQVADAKRMVDKVFDALSEPLGAQNVAIEMLCTGVVELARIEGSAAVIRLLRRASNIIEQNNKPASDGPILLN